jgi:hypothetical protein
MPGLRTVVQLGLLLPTFTLHWLLQRLPAPLRVRLDAWSRRVALRRLEKRRVGTAAGR